MATTTPITAEQLSKFHRNDRCELVAGEVRMMSPAGWEHGQVVHRLEYVVGRFIEDRGLGAVFGAETGFLIARDPDTVRAPDFAFIARGNLPPAKPRRGFWPGAPDLAIEVVSPDDRKPQVTDKARAWLAAGAKLVWVVDPETNTVAIYRPSIEVLVKHSSDELDGGDVIIGFRCRVADIFATLVS